MCSLEIEAIFAKMAKIAILDFFVRAKMRMVGDFFANAKNRKILKFFKILKFWQIFLQKVFFFFF